MRVTMSTYAHFLAYVSGCKWVEFNRVATMLEKNLFFFMTPRGYRRRRIENQVVLFILFVYVPFKSVFGLNEPDNDAAKKRKNYLRLGATKKKKKKNGV